MKNDSERKSFVFFAFFLSIAAILTIFSALLLSRNAASFVMYTSLTVFTLIVLLFCIQRKNALFFSLVSVMAALSVVGRMVFSPIVAFKPCTAVIIICGSALGADAGFICGVLTALVSNVYFGQGSWTFFQMFTWGMIGLFSGFFSKIFAEHKLFLYIFGAFSGLFYSVIMDLFSALWMDGDFNVARFIALASKSAPYSVIYSVSNVIFLLLLYKRLSGSLARTVRKFGVTRTVE